MKRKLLIALLCFATALTCAFALPACNLTGGGNNNQGNNDNKDTPHSHTFGEWQTVTPAGCETAGEKKRECTCGEIETEVIPAMGHTYDEWQTVTPATCETAGEKKRECACGEVETDTIPAGHKYVDGICAECGDKVSVGLRYELLDDNTYSVTGIGSCKDKHIIIPSNYNGIPVTSIGQDAFSGCTSLTSITIPNRVTSIGSCAFASCSPLANITIPDCVTFIDDYAFYNGSSLASVTIGNNVTYISRNTFENCSLLASVTIGNSVTYIGEKAFRNCTSLESITLPDRASIHDLHPTSNSSIF